jgi:hypothetical protein
MSIQSTMEEEMNRCITVERIWMMRLILTLVEMATVIMLQLPMNPMDLVSKRMGKIAIIFFVFYSAYIFYTYRQMLVCVVTSVLHNQLLRDNKRSSSRYGMNW